MTNVQELLNAIHAKKIKKADAVKEFIALGFTYTKVDIATCPFDIDDRYLIQDVFIPHTKRGNLSPFAGKECEVIVTTVSGNGGARVNFFIKAK